MRIVERLHRQRLNDGKRVLHAVVQLVDEQLLSLLGPALFRDVVALDEYAGGFRTRLAR